MPALSGINSGIRRACLGSGDHERVTVIMIRVLSFSLYSLLLALLCLTGCGGGGAAVTGSIAGQVRDATATGIPGVAVSVGGSRAAVLTDADGRFTLANIAPGTVIVQLSKAGYVNTRHTVTVQVGVQSDLTCGLPALANDGAAVNVAAGDQTVIDTGRAAVTAAEVVLQKDSVTTADGSALVGTVNVAITTATPADASFGDLFPGAFSGIVAGAAIPVGIVSFGFIDVTLTDAAGTEVRLNPAKPATIRIPVDPALAGTLPATIELWSLNTATCIWEQVKDAGNNGVSAVKHTVGGKTYYEAQVTHFSPYNLDKPLVASVALTITARQYGTGTPAAGAHVVVRLTDVAAGNFWMADGVTNNQGEYLVYIAPGDEPQITATYNGVAARVGAVTGTGNNRACTVLVPGSGTTSVAFTILNKNNGCIKDAMVEVQPTTDSQVVRTGGPTNADGVATVTGIPYASAYTVRVKLNNVVIGTDATLLPGDATKTIKLLNYP